MTATPSVVDRLKIPPDYSRYESVEDTTDLQFWRKQSISTLRELLNTLVSNGMDTQMHAQYIMAVVPFVQDREDAEVMVHRAWTSSASSALALDILRALPSPTIDTVGYVLEHLIKPLFLATPHPLLSTLTGRAIAGAKKGQEFYDGQVWKKTPGLGAVIVWCAGHLDAKDYETHWPLVIPPVVTLIDDFEAKWKLDGVHAVREVLRRVSPELIKRTGVYGLLDKSLHNCLAHLTRAESPRLIRSTIRTLISLAQQCTPPASQSRFDALSIILGEGIIGSIWSYSGGRRGVVRASVEELPGLLEVMGVGAARFLQPLIKELTVLMVGGGGGFTGNHGDMEEESEKGKEGKTKMQIAAAHAMRSVVKECAPCMERWGTQVLFAAAKCWVNAWNDMFPKTLKDELQLLCADLVKTEIKKGQTNLKETCRGLQDEHDMFRDMLRLCP